MSLKRQPQSKKSQRINAERRNISGVYNDPIVSSAEIKRIIVSKIIEYDLDPRLLSVAIGLDETKLSNLYLKKKKPMRTPNLSSYEIINLASILGVQIKINLYLKPSEEINVEELKRQYGKA
jgi:hypothetical protein